MSQRSLRSPDGGWEWDGARWMPVADGGGSRSRNNPWTGGVQGAAMTVLSISALYDAVVDLLGPLRQANQSLSNAVAAGERSAAILYIAQALFPLLLLGGAMAAATVSWAAVLIAGAALRWRWVFDCVFASSLAGGGFFLIAGIEGAGQSLTLVGPLSAASFLPVYLLAAVACLNVALGIWMGVRRRHARRSRMAAQQGAVG